MANNHRVALEILSDEEVDFRCLVYKIAAKYPAAIVNVVGRPKKQDRPQKPDTLRASTPQATTPFGLEDNTRITCLALCREGLKINAIKRWKNDFDCSLQEAKIGVENLMRDNGVAV